MAIRVVLVLGAVAVCRCRMLVKMSFAISATDGSSWAVSGIYNIQYYDQYIVVT